jgi:hypothetical protein
LRDIAAAGHNARPQQFYSLEIHFVRDQARALRKQKTDILRTIRDFQVGLSKEADGFAAPLSPVSDELLPQTLFASSALSALMTLEDPHRPFQFRVHLTPENADEYFLSIPGRSFDYSIDISTENVELHIHAVPSHLLTAPGEYLHVLVTFLAVSAYIEGLKSLYPAKRWTMPMPAETMLMDALNTSEQARVAARRHIWS